VFSWASVIAAALKAFIAVTTFFNTLLVRAGAKAEVKLEAIEARDKQEAAAKAAGDAAVKEHAKTDDGAFDQDFRR
jgi:hypothetical protein